MLSNFRYPDVFVDAKELIKSCLESRKLSVKTYGSMFSRQCDVLHYHIGDKDDEESYSNLRMVITYKMPYMDENERFTFLEKTRNLLVLSSSGDTRWTYRARNKIWDGEYPSTVAIDTETGDVMFFNLKPNRIELVFFGVLEGTAFDTVMSELHDREPFKIALDPDAMFNYIDESEGINHLKSNVLVIFNCGIPITVKHANQSAL